MGYETGGFRETLTEHTDLGTGVIYSVAFSLDGKTLAPTREEGEDNTVQGHLPFLLRKLSSPLSHYRVNPNLEAIP